MGRSSVGALSRARCQSRSSSRQSPMNTTTRSEAMRDRLLVMAYEMERDAACKERQEAAETDREAG